MNRLHQQVKTSKAGSALVVVMGVILLIAMVAAGMVTVGRQQIYSTERLRDYVKAQLIAESGANSAYSLIKTNFEASNNPDLFPLTPFAEGTYDVTILPISSNMVSIVSTGVCGMATAIARVDCKNFPLTTTNGAPTQGQSAFGCTVLSGGYLEWVGNQDLQTSNSWMHCNSIFTANGANKIYANISSHVSIGLVGGATIMGTAKAPSITGGTATNQVITSVPLIAIPDIDLTPYYNAALAKGQVFNGDKWMSGTVTPSGGIMWVNGTLYLGNGNYTGCFIATAGIVIQTTGQGSVNVQKTAQYPILVSRDGDILVKQTKMFSFNGLIYCKTGSFDKQGNGDVLGIGSIIAAGNVSKNGGWAGMIYNDSTPIPPGGSDASVTDKVVITAWQD